jgi:hypothetical protein
MDGRIKSGHDDRKVRSESAPKEKSRLPAGPSLLSFALLSLGLKSELTSALALLIAVLALTVRILPLLSGLLAATLLLTGLLTRVLVLLPRVFFLAGHSGSPFVDPSPR